MNQADRIRACAKERFVEPARRKKQTTVEIVARDVARELGLSNRMQNICRALQSDKFLAMAGVELLDPKRTKPTATARFRYAIKQSATGAQKPAGALASFHRPPATVCREEAGASRPRTPDYTLVIPCAARKRPDAGRLLAEDGTPVHFVANPSAAPRQPNVAYRRPDGIARSSLSWRQVLQQYDEIHRGRDDNPLGLLPAWQLYKDATYRYVVEQLGEANVFILSAGWGLIPAAFLNAELRHHALPAWQELHQAQEQRKVGRLRHAPKCIISPHRVRWRQGLCAVVLRTHRGHTRRTHRLPRWGTASCAELPLRTLRNHTPHDLVL